MYQNSQNVIFNRNFYDHRKFYIDNVMFKPFEISVMIQRFHDFDSDRNFDFHRNFDPFRSVDSDRNFYGTRKFDRVKNILTEISTVSENSIV